MNWYALKNRIKYGWKRDLAIFFASIGTAIQITLFILLFFQEGGLDPLMILSYGIVLLAYYYLLSGNIKGTTTAYRGVMLFVFFNFFDFAQYFFFNLLDLLETMVTAEPLIAGLAIGMLASFLVGFISGLMTYIHFRRYMMIGYDTTYEKVRNWCLVFLICILLSYGVSIALDAYMYFLAGGSDLLSVLLLVLEPVSIICMGICSYVTILRLKDR